MRVKRVPSQKPTRSACTRSRSGPDRRRRGAISAPSPAGRTVGGCLTKAWPSAWQRRRQQDADHRAFRSCQPVSGQAHQGHTGGPLCASAEPTYGLRCGARHGATDASGAGRASGQRSSRSRHVLMPVRPLLLGRGSKGRVPESPSSV